MWSSYRVWVTDTKLSLIGSLLADDTRAGILTILMDGRSHTGGELARYMSVAPSTASEHLSKLLDGGLVAAEAQGRHRYFRLAGPEVGQMLEVIGASPASVPVRSERGPAALAFARSCYDHLAGKLAVRIFTQLISDGLLSDDDHRLRLTETGYELLGAIGAHPEEVKNGRRPPGRACLDWTERRHHLAGAAGAAILEAILANRWMRHGQRPRSLRLTNSGKQAIPRHFGIPPL